MGKYIEAITIGKTSEIKKIIGLDRKLTGIIAVADKMKESSRRVIEVLHKIGFQVAIVIGDNKKQQLLSL